MKIKLFLLLCLSFSMLAFSQNPITSHEEEQSFEYVEIKGEIDFLVDFTMINPECATKDQNFYSIIIGTTIVDDYLERISVLVPCLSNEFVKGDLISIKPIKTPKKNIVYAIRSYLKGDEEITEVFGSEYRAIWGEVVKVY